MRSITRRDFLIGTAATAVLAACSDGSSKASPSSTAAPTTALTPTTRRNPALPGDPFGLGVASGDPRPDSVILWARLAPNPRAANGLGGMPSKPVDVSWELAADERFTKGVTRGVATADADAGHSLHIAADGLDPATDYYYRFTVGEWTSPIGRTRTLPAPGDTPTRFALAIANCQMLDTGRYGAYRHMRDEDLDLVVHLGDYIYEYPGKRALPNRVPSTLADFRLRHASYRSDPELQAAHGRFPFVLTWDDHDVRNNYMSNIAEDGTPPEQFADIRAAAYRAWWEYLPVRVPQPESADVPIYGHTDIGDLIRLYMLDTRGYADEPPCRGSGSVGDLGNCDARTAEDRTLLGAKQESWFADATKESRAQWNIVGNPVALSGIDAGRDQTAYWLDCWDGFPQARSRFLSTLAETDNPVVLTGDYHQGLVFDTHRDPFEQDSKIIATEFLSPPISSVLFSDDVTARTPQVRQQIDAHGYLTVAVEPDRVTTNFRILDDVAKVSSPIRTEATWVVSAGTPRAVKQ